jgi:hypothetical protein
MATPCAELFNDYKLADGRVWSLILMWIAVAPAVVRKLHRGQSRSPHDNELSASLVSRGRLFPRLRLC